jgi:hypothetical protein
MLLKFVLVGQRRQIQTDHVGFELVESKNFHRTLHNSETMAEEVLVVALE